MRRQHRRALFMPPRTHQINVIDALGARTHTRDQRGQLGSWVGRCGFDPGLRRYSTFSESRCPSAPVCLGPIIITGTSPAQRHEIAPRRTPLTPRRNYAKLAPEVPFRIGPDCCVRTPIIPVQRALSSFRHPDSRQSISGSRLKRPVRPGLTRHRTTPQCHHGWVP